MAIILSNPSKRTNERKSYGLVFYVNHYSRLIVLITLLTLSLVASAQKTLKGRQLYYVNDYSESKAKAYFDNTNDLDPIEGIWIRDGFKYSIEKDYDGYTRNPDKFRAVIIGFPNNTAQQIGNIQFFLEKGAVAGVYSSTYYLFRASWKKGQRQYNIEPFLCVSIMDSPISLSSKLPILDGDLGNITGYDTEHYIKIYPNVSTEKPYPTIEDSASSILSGTGFALNNGYIATNYHVVEDAKNIVIKGVNGDFNNVYSAEIIATDKHNDLALLRITDVNFNGFGTVPYKVKTSIADVGEDVFVLGYPLTNTMGDEIKLTTGVVSSRTGYQGYVALYQISAPVQPGNSGGPLFDGKGDLIGIVSAKHTGAENVGYAIKASYLQNLIESSISDNIIPSHNTISTMPLTDKVKNVKSFVFLIECSR